MNYLAAALALACLGLSAGWWADRQSHAAELGELRLTIARCELDLTQAELGAEVHARALEGVQAEITRETDHAYQNDRARLARVPVERLRRAAQEAAGGTGIRPPALPHTAGSAHAAGADPVPDPGCDRLAVDAAETTLMLYRLQRWAEGIEHSCNAISAVPEADE